MKNISAPPEAITILTRYGESYTGGSVATGRDPHIGQVKGDDPNLQFGVWAWG